MHMTISNVSTKTCNGSEWSNEVHHAIYREGSERIKWKRVEKSVRRRSGVDEVVENGREERMNEESPSKILISWSSNN